jgi:glucosamine--fructose-6-phosphate aminotransferase (isomerizing)
VIEELLGKKDALVEELNRKHFSRIVTTGCGSTYYLGKSAAYFLALYTGHAVQALPASEVWLNPKLFPVQDTLLLAISRSGTTTETIQAVDRFRREGGAAVAVVTCYPENPLAEMADVVLSAASAQEESVVQTRSFTSMYLLSAGLAYSLGNKAELLTEMIRKQSGIADRDDKTATSSGFCSSGVWTFSSNLGQCGAFPEDLLPGKRT